MTTREEAVRAARQNDDPHRGGVSGECPACYHVGVARRMEFDPDPVWLPCPRHGEGRAPWDEQRRMIGEDADRVSPWKRKS